MCYLFIKFYEFKLIMINKKIIILNINSFETKFKILILEKIISKLQNIISFWTCSRNKKTTYHMI